MVLLEDGAGRRARELDRYGCTSVDDDGRRCQLMVGHRYNHAVMLAAASYVRWGDDGVVHAERMIGWAGCVRRARSPGRCRSRASRTEQAAVTPPADDLSRTASLHLGRQMRTHLRYTGGVAASRVLTMRELRQGLAEVVDDVQSGGEVFAGSHRKPEVELMSVEQFERLTAVQERAVASSAASMQMEGMTVTDVERVAAGELAAGQIDFAEYARRVDAQ